MAALPYVRIQSAESEGYYNGPSGNPASRQRNGGSPDSFFHTAPALNPSNMRCWSGIACPRKQCTLSAGHFSGCKNLSGSVQTLPAPPVPPTGGGWCGASLFYCRSSRRTSSRRMNRLPGGKTVACRISRGTEPGDKRTGMEAEGRRIDARVESAFKPDRRAGALRAGMRWSRTLLSADSHRQRK